jgi:hypothetical protein
MGGSKKRLLDGLFRRRCNDSLTRLEDDRGYDDIRLNWWAHQDLNLEPTDYESAALTN